jgi:pimeloyl-ACP methyl ester carboxylesterase
LDSYSEEVQLPSTGAFPSATWERGNEGTILIEYPGYGKSEGRATIAAHRAAANKALEALAKHLGIEEIALQARLNVIAHSFGTGLALDFATQYGVQNVVLVAPFSTLREEAALVTGKWLSYLLIENYDNRTRLRELSERSSLPRVAIFHGTNDDIIPVTMGRELAEAHPTMVQFFPIAGGDHLSPLFKNGAEILAWMNQDPPR